MNRFREENMQRAFQAASRSTCLRRNVGVVLEKYGRVVIEGKNYSTGNVCSQKGCYRETNGIPSGESPEQCRAIHAEMDVLLQAHRSGIPVEGCSIYVTCSPCSICARLLVESKIKKVYYREEYPDPFAFEILESGGVEAHQV